MFKDIKLNPLFCRLNNIRKYIYKSNLQGAIDDKMVVST